MTKTKNSDDLAGLILSLKSQEDVQEFIDNMFTQSEWDTLSKRWNIIKMLDEGRTQRDISKELQVSLCKVTRGSKILKNKDSVIYKFLKNN